MQQHSHEPIISPMEFEQVQAELARRKKIGNSFSGKSPFSAKIVCGDCGGFYGHKIWHSNDKYRRVVWRCNRKYESERKKSRADRKNKQHELVKPEGNTGRRCTTPTLSEDDIKSLFIKAFSQLLGNMDGVIEDCNTLIAMLEDTSALDEKIKTTQAEIDRITSDNKALIRNKALFGTNRTALTGHNSNALTGTDDAELTKENNPKLTAPYDSALTNPNDSALTGTDDAELTKANSSVLTGTCTTVLSGMYNTPITPTPKTDFDQRVAEYNKQYKTAHQIMVQLKGEKSERLMRASGVRKYVGDLRGILEKGEMGEMGYTDGGCNLAAAKGVWDEQAWRMLVTQVTVHADGTADFLFRGENRITVCIDRSIPKSVLTTTKQRLTRIS